MLSEGSLSVKCCGVYVGVGMYVRGAMMGCSHDMRNGIEDGDELGGVAGMAINLMCMKVGVVDNRGGGTYEEERVLGFSGVVLDDVDVGQCRSLVVARAVGLDVQRVVVVVGCVVCDCRGAFECGPRRRVEVEGT